MASNHVLDPATFNDPISMIDGSDTISATQVRAILEAIADNTAFNKGESEAAAQDARRSYGFTEDFVGAVVDGDNLITSSGVWQLSGTGTPSMSVQAGDAGAPGILRIVQSAGANHSAFLRLGSADIGSIDDVESFEIRYRWVTNAIAGKMYFGLAGGAFDDTGFASPSRHFEVTATDDGRSVSQQGGTDYQPLGAAILDTAFHTVTIDNPNSNPSASALYAATGHTAAETASHTTNLVTSGTVVGLVLIVACTNPAAGKTLEVDCIKLKLREIDRGGP